MKSIILIAILVLMVGGCASTPKQVDRVVRANELSASQIIEIVKIHFENNHSPLKSVGENTLIGDVVSDHRKTRNTKVTIRLDAEDGQLRVQYSNVVNSDRYVTRKQFDRMLGRYNRSIEYALAAGSD